MASRIRNKSSFNTASRARITLFRYCVIPMLASTTMIEITMSSSIIVKPAAGPVPRALRTLATTAYQSLYFVPSSAVPVLSERTSNTFWPPQLVVSGLS